MQHRALQQRLAELGYYRGPIDGLPGPGTQAALSAFQANMALGADGEADPRTLELLFSDKARPAPAEKPREVPPIDEDEVVAHIAAFRRILEAPDEAAKGAAIVEGFMTLGLRFVAGFNLAAEHVPELPGQAMDVLIDWLGGQRYTRRSDEDERRAMVAAELLESGGAFAGLRRLALRSLLDLPAGHPLRDDAKISAGLMDWLERLRVAGEPEGRLLTIQNLLSLGHESVATQDALIEEGLGVLEAAEDRDIRRNFLTTAYGSLIGRLKREEEDAGVDPAGSPLVPRLEALLDRIDALGGEPRLLAKNTMTRALLQETTGRWQEAADSFREAMESGSLDDSTVAMMARLEARLRTALGQFERVVEALAPLAGRYEEDYLAAVGEERERDAGETFGEAMTMLAVAHAHAGRWDEAVRELEHGKSLRLRHRVAMRRSPSGRELLDMESKLHALGRGIEVELAPLERYDLVGRQVSLQAQALEHYRTLRPSLEDGLLARAGIGETGRCLGEGEAVLCLGLGRGGLIAAVIGPGEDAGSAACRLWSDWSVARVAELLLGKQADGWIMAVGDRIRTLEPRAPLSDVVAAFETLLGRWLAKALGQRQVRRLHLIPHHFLQIVPFWALPSLSGLDVAVWPSAAQLVDDRPRPPRALRRMLGVADPTLDLPLAAAELEILDRHLAGGPVALQSLARTDAAEDAVTRRMEQSDGLHFCGHGIADMVDPLRSGLLLSPAWEAMPVGSVAALEQLGETAVEWRALDDEHRETRLPGAGILVEWRLDDGTLMERRLEYGPHGTLWLRYGPDGTAVRAAELWSAGDIAVHGAMGEAALVVLSACKTGLSGISEPYEQTGLPAALLLAGVQSVVASLWPVSDALSTFYMDLFYARLAEARGEVDLAGLVRALNHRLRDMPRDEACALMQELRGRIDRRHKQARWRLEAFIRTMERGGDRPFAHPYDWAAFCVFGKGRVTIPGDRS